MSKQCLLIALCFIVTTQLTASTLDLDCVLAEVRLRRVFDHWTALESGDKRLIVRRTSFLLERL
jgi:hypothetical protein